MTQSRSLTYFHSFDQALRVPPLFFSPVSFCDGFGGCTPGCLIGGAPVGLFRPSSESSFLLMRASLWLR